MYDVYNKSLGEPKSAATEKKLLNTLHNIESRYIELYKGSSTTASATVVHRPYACSPTAAHSLLSRRM